MHPYTLTHPSLSAALAKAASCSSAVPIVGMPRTAPLARVAPAWVFGSGKPAAARGGVNGRRWAGPITRRGRTGVVPKARFIADVISGAPTA